jgi:hypothetical protein
MRVAPISGATQTGVLISLDADSVRIVDRTGVRHAFARGGLRRLEMSLGEGRRVGRAVGRGALIGAGAGLLLGVGASTEESGWGSPCDGAGCVPLGIGVGALWGAGIGGLIGVAVKSEQWQRIDAVPAEPAVAPVAYGIGIGVKMRF